MKLRSKHLLISSMILLVVTLAARAASAAPWEAPTPADLARLVEGRDWPLVMAFVIGAVVRQLQRDARFPITVPKRFMPFVPWGLGLASAIAESIAKDVPWRAALAGGALSAAISMIGHDVAKGVLGRNVPLPTALKARPKPATTKTSATEPGAEATDAEIATTTTVAAEERE